MSFTHYKWGVSKPYRALWPILAFSSLRTDYYRVVQVNNFFFSVVDRIFKRLKSFKKFICFSHILIKNFSVRFYDRPLFNIEVFFWIKRLKDLLSDKFIKPKKNKKIFKVKKSKKYVKEIKFFKRNKFKRFRKIKRVNRKKRRPNRLKHKKTIFKRQFKVRRLPSRGYYKKRFVKRILLFRKRRKPEWLFYPRMLREGRKFKKMNRDTLISNYYTTKNKYKLIGYTRVGFILFKYKCRKFLRKIKYKKPIKRRRTNLKKDIFNLVFRKSVAQNVLNYIKVKPRKPKKQSKRRPKFKRYEYFRRLVNKRSRHLRISRLQKKPKNARRIRRLSKKLAFLKYFRYRLNVLNLIKFVTKAKKVIQLKRIVFFLSILSDAFKLLRLNVVVAARLITLSSGNVYLYLNHFTERIARRREINPKSLVKSLIRDLSRSKKQLRITGAIVKVRGRFSRRDRAPRVRMSFGNVSVATLKSRIEYGNKEFTFRFGKGSIKMIIAHAR